MAWGYNGEGQSTVPNGLSGVVAIAAGGDHCLALKSDSTVVAWRSNDDGRNLLPPGLTDVVAIAQGAVHSLVLKADGTVVTWENNDYGQRAVPDELAGVVAIASGYFHSLALKADGTAGGAHSLALVADSPALVVQASGNNILLSWPLSAPGFALQSTTNLADKNSWTPVMTVPVVEGSRNRVTDKTSGPARFYRLKK